MREKIKLFFEDVFSINDARATKEEIKERIIANSKLKGPNMCGLVFAIILASIGLNIDSITVAIGAMIISPLMGGIQGIAYALATTDLKYFKRVLVGFFIEISICIFTSAIYFTFSPIATESSALLIISRPKIWDAVIAFVAGCAGIIALTRKEHSSVVLPGVAVSCSIILPLCRAGYAISCFNVYGLLSSLYLFFINAFFICLSAIIVLKILKLPRKRGVNKKEGIKILIELVVISVVTLIPSSVFAYQAVNEAILESNINKYINNEFKNYSTQVVKSNIDIDKKEFQVTLIGNTLYTEQIIELTEKLKNYNIENMQLKIVQTDYNKLVSDEELEDLKNEISSLKSKLEEKNDAYDKEEIIQKIKENYKKVLSCNITSSKTLNDENYEYNADLIITLTISEELTNEEKDSINEFLKSKIHGQQFEILYMYK